MHMYEFAILIVGSFLSWYLAGIGVFCLWCFFAEEKTATLLFNGVGFIFLAICVFTGALILLA